MPAFLTPEMKSGARVLSTSTRPIGNVAKLKRAARKAGINEAVSPHWLRHTHGSHAIDRGASLPEVQATLGHGNNLHAHRTPRAAYTSILGCFFDDEPVKRKRLRP